MVVVGPGLEWNMQYVLSMYGCPSLPFFLSLYLAEQGSTPPSVCFSLTEKHFQTRKERERTLCSKPSVYYIRWGRAIIAYFNR